MNNNKIQIPNNFIYIVFIFLYASLLLGFYYNENFAGGAIQDFNVHIALLNSLNENFIYSFLNYKDFQTDHSPFFFFFFKFY